MPVAWRQVIPAGWGPTFRRPGSHFPPDGVPLTAGRGPTCRRPRSRFPLAGVPLFAGWGPTYRQPGSHFPPAGVPLPTSRGPTFRRPPSHLPPAGVLLQGWGWGKLQQGKISWGNFRLSNWCRYFPHAIFCATRTKPLLNCWIADLACAVPQTLGVPKFSPAEILAADNSPTPVQSGAKSACPQTLGLPPLPKRDRRIASPVLCLSVLQVFVGLMVCPPVEGEESHELYHKEYSRIFEGLQRRAQTLCAALNDIPGLSDARGPVPCQPPPPPPFLWAGSRLDKVARLVTTRRASRWWLSTGARNLHQHEVVPWFRSCRTLRGAGRVLGLHDAPPPALLSVTAFVGTQVKATQLMPDAAISPCSERRSAATATTLEFFLYTTRIRT